MSRKQVPTDLLDQAKNVLSSWQQFDEQMVFGPLSTSVLANAVDRTTSLEGSITDLENTLIDLRNQRDDAKQHLWDLVKRVRALVKGVYGEDSSQYEMVGCTRLSDRKPARRNSPSAP